MKFPWGVFEPKLELRLRALPATAQVGTQRNSGPGFPLPSCNGFGFAAWQCRGDGRAHPYLHGSRTPTEPRPPPLPSPLISALPPAGPCLWVCPQRVPASGEVAVQAGSGQCGYRPSPGAGAAKPPGGGNEAARCLDPEASSQGTGAFREMQLLLYLANGKS